MCLLLGNNKICTIRKISKLPVPVGLVVFRNNVSFCLAHANCCVYPKGHKTCHMSISHRQQTYSSPERTRITSALRRTAGVNAS